MSVERCPVCEGRGTVPSGFYDRERPDSKTLHPTEPCRSCAGRGVFVLPGERQEVVYPGTAGITRSA